MNWNDKTVLVSGGHGFLGTHVVKELGKKGTKQLLGFVPKISFKVGLKKTIDWFISQQMRMNKNVITKTY